ncbi:TPA: hypothetical protein NI803_004587 [Pseudomonas aeruginosa]|nr:hypothetical protein [Pseudomonas aeruginosa]
MQVTTELQEWADKIAAASRDLDAARQALAEDKQQRETLRAKLVDWLTTTQAEQAVEDETERLAAVTAKARKLAEQWIAAQARARLEASAGDAARHSAQLQRIESARNRHNRVRPLLRLAEEARDRLDTARSACESASTAEVFDLVSSNKGIAIWSSLQTSSASSAVREAGQAVKALADALPKHAEAAALDAPDDFLDLIVDMTIAPDFDVLSLFNMGRLNDAAGKCRQASEKLAPLLDRLKKLDADTAARLTTEGEGLREIETPFLQAAAALVPPIIGAQVPTSLT